MDPETVSDILVKMSLASDEDRRHLLNSIRPFLAKSDSRDILKPHLESSDLSVLFDVLNSSDEETIENGCNIIASVFNFVDKSLLLLRYSKQLNRCLEHPHRDVKNCALNLLTCIATSEDENVKTVLIQNHSLFVSASKCILDASAGVADIASKFLIAVAAIKSESGVESGIFAPPILPLLAEASESKDAVLRMRIYELMVKIAAISQELTERVAREGFLQRLCVEVQDTSDILSQLNAVEILADLAESPHGYRYLESQEILSQMDRLLNQISSDPMADIVLPGFVKFFGRICHQSPEDFVQRFPNFFSILSSGVNDSDKSKQILSIETVAYIGLTSEGRKEIKTIAEPTIKVIRSLLNQGSDHEKIRALSAFGELLKYNGEEASGISETLFDFYGSNTLIDKLTGLMKLPFGDLSSCAYMFFIKLSDHSWSLQKFSSHPGFIEMLLNRDSAREKIPKELKYDLIRKISNHPQVEQLLPENLILRLKKYVAEGAFYVEALPAVAFEGDE